MEQGKRQSFWKFIKRIRRNKIIFMKQIPLVDLPRQNKLLQKEIDQVLHHSVSNALFTMGGPLEHFEEDFARFCNKKYCVGVNSGTDALLFALIAYNIHPGDEVITVPNSYFSTAMVISQLGATVVFVDIDPKTYTIDPKKIEEKITQKTKAIIPVHLYGQPADMDAIITLAKKYNLSIIEDSCQAHGAQYKNVTTPISETGAFSFFPGKNLGGFGDGGALVTDNKNVAKIARLLRNDGSMKKYVHESIGYKSRLHSLQAAILSMKLPHLPLWNSKRNAHARQYSKLLAHVPQITTPQTASYANHAYHLYVIEVNDRDALQKHLAKNGIETGVHYPIPIHLQKPYRNGRYKKGDFPITEEKSQRILSLPLFPELQTDEIEYIVDAIKMFYS